ncbi:hypothetical protein DPMN_091752 [Dreissena polymorpha]|uniref:Uncharacterized protein n=1 Tax=Dreissena polymorpha TaxID=45954 RepID=A0A9D4L031_DREPO|nr:hypothetical protein DPMN_091752 [Dreissena polymorpha]
MFFFDILLTKFHEDGTRNVASRMNILTNFHEDHKENVTSRFFYRISPTFKLDLHFIEINILTNFHEDQGDNLAHISSAKRPTVIVAIIVMFGKGAQTYYDDEEQQR